MKEQHTLMSDITSTEDDRAEVWKVWPDLQKQYDTAEIRANDDQPAAGWGVIHVRDTDTWTMKEHPNGG